MKITFTNVVVEYSGCDCCGSGVVTPPSGPFVIETSNTDVSIEEHAKIAFGNVISFDAEVS